MKNLYYYRQEEAEKIRDTFKSWIGKKAHVGRGNTMVLKSIQVLPKPKTPFSGDSQGYFHVEFEFENNKKFSAREFFFHNSLPDQFHHPLIEKAQNTGCLQ